MQRVEQSNNLLPSQQTRVRRGIESGFVEFKEDLERGRETGDLDFAPESTLVAAYAVHDAGDVPEPIFELLFEELQKREEASWVSPFRSCLSEFPRHSKDPKEGESLVEEEEERKRTHSRILPPKQLPFIKHPPPFLPSSSQPNSLNNPLHLLLRSPIQLRLARADVVRGEIRACAVDCAEEEGEVEVHVLEAFRVGGDAVDETLEVGHLFVPEQERVVEKGEEGGGAGVSLASEMKRA